MNINGTNKADNLLGTAGDDFINGRGGDDWLEGGAGNDTLTGGRGHDTFTLRAGDGNDIVTDFQPGIDRIMFDSETGVYDGILPPLGYLYDGQTFSNSQNTASWTVSAVDANSDGITDTLIQMSTGDSITLLGIAPGTWTPDGVIPGDITSADIFGG